MQCPMCGNEIPKKHRGRPSRFCSPACRKAAERARRKIGAVPPPPKNPKPTVKVSVSKTVDAELDKASFERMRDGTMLDTLRFNRDVLAKALRDPDTPPSALAAISKQHVDVCRQIEQLEQPEDDLQLESEDVNDATVLADLI